VPEMQLSEMEDGMISTSTVTAPSPQRHLFGSAHSRGPSGRLALHGAPGVSGSLFNAFVVL
jgi:hypothetical protein